MLGLRGLEDVRVVTGVVFFKIWVYNQRRVARPDDSR
jgi:hypothetical protein